MTLCVCVCHICISKPHSIRAATSTVILEADTNYWSLRPEAIKPLESGFIYLCAGWEPAAYPVPGIPAGESHPETTNLKASRHEKMPFERR